MNLDTLPDAIKSDVVYGDMIKECEELLDACKTYSESRMPSMTFSHTKARLEQGDEIESRIIQKMTEMSIARHVTARKYSTEYKSETESAFEEYGKSSHFCKSAVNGEARIADLKLTLDCIDSMISALDKYSWIIKSIKTRTADMFEKTG